MLFQALYEAYVTGLEPVPQGSKSVTKRGVMYEANKALPKYRQMLASAFAAELATHGLTEPLDGALRVEIVFMMTRPTSAARREFPSVKPDGDKLQRAAFDALTAAGVWADDARVVEAVWKKRYADTVNPTGEPGVIVSVYRA